MTHEDSLINIELARINRDIAEARKRDSPAMKTIAEATKRDSSAMKTIAEATKRDSSAMKTIAIMTMLFLPATYLAALFNMPSLIQTKFWPYWASTILTTAVVFLVWIVMINWNQLWNYCKNTLKS